MLNLYWAKSFKTPSGRKFAAACTQQRTFRVITWVNILFQLLLPLSLSFTPTIAAAATSKAATANIPTESYILGAGENVNTVAKRNGMTVDELKRINIYRTFSKPFIALTTGDEIDVPRKVSPFSIDNQKNINADVSLENKLASHAQIGAAALATSHVAKSGEQMVRSAANNEFNSQAQQWLSQFGTARVQMNLNDDFKLDGSAADVLVPLYDNQKSMLFTQLGARNTDSRNTINIGAGIRTFHNNWMYGANTFFDNDITGKNRRVGVGAEAWTDYLKLSANSYFGTTDWHQSRDFTEYNERPANGYDVQAEAYLPAYPQLGGKLAYEKYRGDEVALFGKDNRQKNPHAVTAGVNYTPIPLLTVGAEHRTGKSSKNNSSINFQLNYRLGESWQSHINPSVVPSTRTLAGSRYDLVERNNNIVLDYQKQTIMQLTLPDKVTGEALSSAIVNAQVVSNYGLERVDWDSSGLIAAGGSMKQISPQTVSISLPPYQSARSSNIHTLSAVAHDRQGNASPRAIMQIVVMPSTAQITASNLKVTSNNAIANGNATNEVQALVTDINGNTLAGQTVTFSASNGVMVINSTVVTDTNGLASTTLTSTVAVTSSVMATVNGSNQTVPVNFVADVSSATLATLTVLVNDALANGNATNEVQALVTDINGNTLAGQTVTFSASNGVMVTNSTVVTDTNGLASTTLTSTVAVTSSVMATVNGSNQTMPVNFVADVSSATLATLTVLVNDALANGNATNEVQALVTDINGNTLAGQTVTFSASNGVMVTNSTVVTDTNGLASTTLTSTAAVTSSVMATVNGSNQTVPVNFVADVSSATLATLTVLVNDALANGNATNEVQALVTDINGNTLAGQTVTFSASNGVMVTNGTVVTDTNGLASTTLTSTAAVTSSVMATVNGSNQTVPVNFVADVSSATLATLTVLVNDALANGNATNEVQALVTDINGNTLAGQTVTFSASNGVMVTNSTVVTDTNGLASTTLTSASAVTSSVQAILTNGIHATVDVTFTMVTGITSVSANGKTFAVTDGFPSTGFVGAKFTLAVIGAASDYNWSNGGSSWNSVDNSGNVTFTAQGNTTPVTITATPKLGGTAVSYTFTVRNWFINNGSTTAYRLGEAETWCKNQGVELSAPSKLTKGNGIRSIGSLFSEWGPLNNYANAGFVHGDYWTTEILGPLDYTYVNLGTGNQYSADDTLPNYVVCSQSL